MTADLRAESAALADKRPDAIRQPESKRYFLLRLAKALQDEPTDSPFYTAVSDYAVTYSWLPRDIALLSFSALVRAQAGRDMAAVSQTLNELLAGGE